MLSTANANHAEAPVLALQARQTILERTEVRCLSVIQWGIAIGDSWEVLQGFESGRTQVCSTASLPNMRTWHSCAALIQDQRPYSIWCASLAFTATAFAQVDAAAGSATWAHPLDIHLASNVRMRCKHVRNRSIHKCCRPTLETQCLSRCAGAFRLAEAAFPGVEPAKGR